MKEKKVRPGMTIDLKGDNLRAIEAANNILNNSLAGFHEMSSKVRSDNNILWDLVYELYPELRGFHLTFDVKKGKMIVLSERR